VGKTIVGVAPARMVMAVPPRAITGAAPARALVPVSAAVPAAAATTVAVIAWRHPWYFHISYRRHLARAL